jgi:hypothetical protein
MVPPNSPPSALSHPSTANIFDPAQEPIIPLLNVPQAAITLTNSHADHQALNNTWRQYFAQAIPDNNPPILTTNLEPIQNVPRGPDAHEFLDDDDCFRIVYRLGPPTWISFED